MNTIESHFTNTELVINQMLEHFDLYMDGFEYIEPILNYILVGRFGASELEPVIRALLHYIKCTNNINYAESMFVGLCAVFKVKPNCYLGYLTGRSLKELDYAKEQANHCMLYE
eukprot:NODE_29_length_37665_cov_1.081563.p31 type:complete len:114 gc:universal NODE_29_length_37665_cov_1.081563:13000-12659(-)